MKLLLIDSWDQVRKHRKSIILWLLYNFVMVTLCVTNIVFFIYHFSDLTININDTTNVLLTIIGFLFAFAGINIYSIFNTNIEAERRKLNDLNELYKAEISTSIRTMDYSRKLVQFYQLGILITYSKKFNGQLFDWVIKEEKIIDDFKFYLKELYDEGNTKQFEGFKESFIEEARSIRYSMNAFLEYIGNEKKQFFSSLSKADIKNFIIKIDRLIFELDELNYYDFTKNKPVNEIETSPKSLRERIKFAWEAIKKIF